MRVAVYSRTPSQEDLQEVLNFLQILNNESIDYCVNNELADYICDKVELKEDRRYKYLTPNPCFSDFDMVISYGGDGTFINATKLIAGSETPILGINSGRLGFLANVAKNDIENAIKAVKEKKYSVEKRFMLKVEGDFIEKPDFPYAFNEFSVQKNDMNMIAVDVKIDGEFLAKYWSDGVLLSTPSGSTAYSMSVGGPIIAPDCMSMVISPISPHNLNMRSLVVKSDSVIDFHVSTRQKYCMATIDNNKFDIANGAHFQVTTSSIGVNVVNLDNTSFYKTIRSKLFWGVDARL